MVTLRNERYVAGLLVEATTILRVNGVARLQRRDSQGTLVEDRLATGEETAALVAEEAQASVTADWQAFLDGVNGLLDINPVKAPLQALARVLAERRVGPTMGSVVTNPLTRPNNRGAS